MAAGRRSPAGTFGLENLPVAGVGLNVEAWHAKWPCSGLEQGHFAERDRCSGLMCSLLDNGLDRILPAIF